MNFGNQLAGKIVRIGTDVLKGYIEVCNTTRSVSVWVVFTSSSCNLYMNHGKLDIMHGTYQMVQGQYCLVSSVQDPHCLLCLVQVWYCPVSSLQDQYHLAPSRQLASPITEAALHTGFPGSFFSLFLSHFQAFFKAGSVPVYQHFGTLVQYQFEPWLVQCRYI